MIYIEEIREKEKKYRTCNCCRESNDDVVEIYFRTELNNGTCVSLCRKCREELVNVIMERDSNG